MTAQGSVRRWLCIALFVAAPASAQQVDYDAIRSGVNGCSELAADPTVGDLGAALCRPLDRGSLDLPTSALAKTFEVRAGSFSAIQRDVLLGLARGPLGETEYARLRALLLAGNVLSARQESLRRAWLAQAADPATAPAIADALRAQAAALVAGTFDAAQPALLVARADRDRLADLQRGILRSLGPRDVLSPFEAALAQNLSGVANLGASLPATTDPDGEPLFRASAALLRVYPYFAGPDGAPNTADDLPYVAANSSAQAAGYSLAPPIAGTSEDRFDLTSGGLALYTAAARRTVDSVSTPGARKTVEVYGVYNPVFLVRSVCAAQLGGTFDAATGRCTASGGADLTASARSLGCASRADRGRALGLFGVGANADGDCIELNSASQSGSIVQYEVLALLADPVLRPGQAGLEPVDLTDLGLRSLGAGSPPARPASPSANVAFPNLPATFARRVDPEAGAPLAPAASARCRVRVNASSVPVGPNGVAGDADDAVPSDGGCLLWGPVEPGGVQRLRSPAAIAADASSNQSLFHTLCTLSFDGDTGSCRLDELDDPRTFGALSALLGGVGSASGALLDGLATVRTDPADVTRRHAAFFQATFFQPVNPVAFQTDPTQQDFGLVAEPAQAALLGCGVPFASPCTSGQGQLWAGTPALAASLGARRLGGIDLLNASASVVVQEFATVKALANDTLVGTAPGASGGLVYLPGVNWSRNGSFATRPAPGGGTVQVETGATLSLTPVEALALGPTGRASYQHGGASKVQADGWVEPMPWAIDPDALARFGAVVFRADPSDPLAGPGNVFVPGGEYCGRWMLGSELEVDTPFNQTCTLLEAVSANLERWIVARAVVGPDEVFDPPESLAELVAMLDGDPENDATGDPLAGPDGIFARNQRVFRADEMDFEVVEARDSQQLGFVQIDVPGEDETTFDFMTGYDPDAQCGRIFCFLQVNEVLTDPGDAQSSFALVLALPLGAEVDRLAGGAPTGETVKVNLARLSLEDRHRLNRLLAGESVVERGQQVRMNAAQRRALFGVHGDANQRGVDLDGDGSTDLDRDRDGVYDGADDFTPGPVSDDEILCGSGIPGDLLQDGLQYEPWRDADAPGSGAFGAALPQGLAPRSPVFCRGLNALLALTGPSPAGSDAFLWHDGAPPPGADTDGDRWPDVVDGCPTIADRDQADSDGDGVGDVCDSCVDFPNPRVSRDFLRSNPWATLTGGQRDDDHDGYGNVCDAVFPPRSSGIAGGADQLEFRASNAHGRAADDCGRSGTLPCAIFDLDERGTLISATDLARFRELFARPAGPKCPTCPLACEAGPQGSCD